MVDGVRDAAMGEPATPWLSPSEALTRFVSAPQQAHEGVREAARIRFGFRVGNIGVLIPSGILAELVEEAEIYEIPTTSTWFRGLINLRGNLVPVFDLKDLFALEDEGAGLSNLLVVGSAETAVGVLIDGSPRTLHPRQRLEQLPPLPAPLRGHTRAAYAWEQEIWIDFDLERFFEEAGKLMGV